MNAISERSAVTTTSTTTDSTDTTVKNKRCGRNEGEKGLSESIREGGCVHPPYGETDSSAIDQITEKFSEIIDKLISSFQQMFEGFMKLLSEKLAPQPEAPATDPGTGEAPGTGETPPPDDSTGGTTPPPDDTTETPPPDDTSGTGGTEGPGETPPTDNDSDCGTETDETTKKLNKTGEFTWNPKADSTGKLVVVLPHRLSKAAASVRIVDKDGKVLAAGTFSRIGEKDNRARFQFNKAGDKFPDGCFVEITRKNGTVIRQEIKETSQSFHY